VWRVWLDGHSETERSGTWYVIGDRWRQDFMFCDVKPWRHTDYDWASLWPLNDTLPNAWVMGVVGLELMTTRVNSWPVRVGFVVDKVALGQVFLPGLLPTPISIIPPTPHTHLHLHVAFTKRSDKRNFGIFHHAMLFRITVSIRRAALPHLSSFCSVAVTYDTHWHTQDRPLVFIQTDKCNTYRLTN
jgi:hypothetical protein